MNKKPTEMQLQKAVRTILSAFDDPEREGLQETPRRYIKFLREFTNYEKFNFTTFTNEGNDQMIAVSGIPFYSLCEHHLAPFHGTAAVAYIPDEKIVGLSKLPRALLTFANRFQNQERITKQTVEYLQEMLKPKGVAVMLRAQHLCMSMRGVRVHDTWTTTSALSGVFAGDAATKAEFFAIAEK